MKKHCDFGKNKSIYLLVVAFLLQVNYSVEEKVVVTVMLLDMETLAYDYAKKAADDINNNQNILPNVHINIFQQKSLAKPTAVLRDVLINLGSGKLENVLALFGPLASGEIPTVYKIATKRALLQVNYNAVDKTFSLRNKYPFLFNSCQLYETYESALTKVLWYYDWKKIGIFYQSPDHIYEIIFYETAESFERHIREKGINDITIQSLTYERIGFQKNFQRFVEEYKEKLKKNKENDIRIMLVLMNRIPLRYLFCEAYHLGMYGPKYAYLVFYSQDFEDWLPSEFGALPENTRCSPEELLEVAKSAIFIDRHATIDDDIITVNNQTVGEIWNNVTKDPKAERRYLYLYDGLWGFALSLHKVVQKERITNDSLSKNKTMILKMLAHEFENVDFQGTTGRFKYNKEDNRRYRSGDIALRRYEFQTRQDGKKKGAFSSLGTVGSSGIFLKNVSRLRAYPMPRDRPRLIKAVKTYPDLLITFIWVFCGIGISVASIFFTVNVIYRNLKFIKLSSPNINSLICVGCIVLYIAIILDGLDTSIVNAKHIPSLCNATVLLLSMGFTLTFGSLFSKTWRIYRIFTRSQSLRSAVIKDVHLFSIVVVLLLVDLVIFTVWVSISPYQLGEFVIKSMEDKKMDTIEEDVYHRCQCKYQSIFLAVLASYKGVLLLFGLFVAFETRHIRVEAINDAKHIGMAVYNLALIVPLCSIVVYALYDTSRYQEMYTVFSIGILEVTTVTLCLVFLPKVNIILLEDYEDPNFKNGRPVIPPTKSNQKSFVNEYYSYSSRKISDQK